MERLPIVDRTERASADAVRLRGLLGGRLESLRLNRLHNQEDYHLLWPFQEHCPIAFRSETVYRYAEGQAPHPEITRGDWQGEFMGTWVATAALVARNSGDDELRAKLDRLVEDWLATQEQDGYLGTYDEADRWKSWDVWIQAHDLIGLVVYHEIRGSEIALEAAVRVADRVLADFGPGRRSLHTTGPHGGMASSAILEPLLWLYRHTGAERYLEFGRWLVEEDWEARGGPAIISTLGAGRGVAAVGNAKGAEMLIDLTGLVELYRATGDERYLRTVLAAWEDITRHHLYVTGSASIGEFFSPDYALPNDGVYRIGETCVTMTWIYLNLSLGRLTGDARFFDVVEQALYNHLLAAQSPDGRGWAYYVGLRDAKRYRWHTDPECCPTRGARTLSLMPQSVFAIDDEGLVLNLYEAAEAELTLRTGATVGVAVETRYPFDGSVRLEVRPQREERFALRLRPPGWCTEWRVAVDGQGHSTATDSRGYVVLDRAWSAGDAVEIELEMPPRVVTDMIGNRGRAALMRGPLVYAADTSYLPSGQLIDDVALRLPAAGVEAVPVDGSVHLHVPVAWVRADGGHVWGEGQRYRYLAAGGVREEGTVELVPFFEAGNRDPDCYRDGVWPNEEASRRITYQVWLPYVVG